MSKVIVGGLALVVGLLIGTFFGGALTGGAAAGIGIATGLGAGICSTVHAAEEEGLLTPEQIDLVLNRAAADMAAMAGQAAPAPVVGSVSDCAGVLDKLRDANS